jgi:hypothetical protein
VSFINREREKFRQELEGLKQRLQNLRNENMVYASARYILTNPNVKREEAGLRTEEDEDKF